MKTRIAKMAIEMRRNEMGELIEEEVFDDPKQNEKINNLMEHLDNTTSLFIDVMKEGFRNCEPKVGVFLYIEDEDKAGQLEFGSFFGDAEMEAIMRIAMDVSSSQGKEETEQ